MELPFYLMSAESPGVSWDGTITHDAQHLHIVLRQADREEGEEIDIPIAKVNSAEFLRGLVNCKFSLKVGREVREQFPAGVEEDSVELLVARDDRVFDSGPSKEAAFERLAGALNTGTAAALVG